MLDLPDTSEAILSIPEFYRANIPISAVVAGLVVPGQLGPVEYRFSAYEQVIGLLVLPADGLAATLSQLSVEIFDTHEKALFTDGRGLTRGPQQGNAAPCLSLAGTAFRPFPLDRIVRPHDRWTFAIKNHTFGLIRVSTLALITRALRRA